MKNFLKTTLFIAVFSCFAFISQNATEKKEVFKVVIDAGHGGKDAGHISEGIEEGLVNLKITEKIKTLHSNKRVKLYFTRTNNEFISLDDRVKMINEIQPDLLLSLHTNAHTSEAFKGMEIYLNDNAHKTKSLKAASTIVSNTATKEKFGEVKVKMAGFKILKDSKVPALLVELGFLTNPDDRDYLTSEKGQEEIAKALLQSIDKM